MDETFNADAAKKFLENRELEEREKKEQERVAALLYQDWLTSKKFSA